jgi:hypothetical protein
MIDDAPGQNWEKALLPDHRSLKPMTTEELTGPFIKEKVAQWHGISLGEARDMIGAELRRRTRTNDYGQA